jgi:myo-inositol-1(or 4)-monophosphatase
MIPQQRAEDCALVADYMAAAREACDIARTILLARNGMSSGRVHRKRHLDFWTATDVRIERCVVELLVNRWPSHSVVGEELPPHVGDGVFTWYIDPVDGTNNLIAQRPEVAFSIALYYDENPMVAAIDLPHRQLRFTGTAGSAPRVVSVHGERIVTRIPVAQPLQLMGLPGDLRGDEERARVARAVEQLSQRFGLRVSGALAYDLATMLMGELVARVSFGPKPVDVAAAALLLRGAGAKITDADGGAFSMRSASVLATATPALHRQLLAALSAHGERNGDQ